MNESATAAIEGLETAIANANIDNVRHLPLANIGMALKSVASSAEIQMAALDAQNWCTGLIRAIGVPGTTKEPEEIAVARRNAENAVHRLKLILESAPSKDAAPAAPLQ